MCIDICNTIVDGLDSYLYLAFRCGQGHQEAESHALLKLPSAVTVAGKRWTSLCDVRGEPVAASGDMIYLGGGLYACAEKKEKKELPKEKRARKPRRLASRQSEAEQSAQSASPHSEGLASERLASRNGSISSAPCSKTS